MAFDITAIINIIIAIAILLWTAVWAMYTRKHDQVARRKDVLMPLMKEFDESSEMEFAKRILDKKRIDVYNSNSLNGEYYHETTKLKIILRYHLPKNDKDIPTSINNSNWNFDKFSDEESSIRKSFDTLLNFLCKLDYLVGIDTITFREVYYFGFYIRRAAENNAVRCYIGNYKFPLHGNLHNRLDVDYIYRNLDEICTEVTK